MQAKTDKIECAKRGWPCADCDGLAKCHAELVKEHILLQKRVEFLIKNFNAHWHDFAKIHGYGPCTYAPKTQFLIQEKTTKKEK